jgi:hypothetical protein
MLSEIDGYHKMSVDIKIQTHINTFLRSLPHLSNIIPPYDNKTRLQFDQYKGKIPLGREAEIKESTIYEILLGAQHDRQFTLQIQRLEDLSSQYPKYCTPEFGKHIIASFFSAYSELELYDALISHEFTPIPDPSILPGDKSSKKADFKIEIEGTDIYIEIFTPRLPRIDEIMFEDPPKAGLYDPGKGIGNHSETFHPVEYKIIREYEHHFKDYEPRFKIPLIFVLDITLGHCETPGLFGTMNIEDLFERYSFPDYFIGILVYRRIYYKDRIARTSQFYINPRFSGSKAIPTILSHIME